MFDETRGLLSADPARVSEFDSVFYGALGSSWAEAMDDSFDWQLATESIAFYDASVIPKPHNTNPQVLFDIRFRADLGSATALVDQDVIDRGGLFASSVPSRIQR